LNATFGKTGGLAGRSKSHPKDYAKSVFIEKADGDFIDFHYDVRDGMDKIAKHIPRADAKWLGERLALLSEAQIRDAFIAAGFKDEDVTIYTQTVQKRIAELTAL